MTTQQQPTAPPPRRYAERRWTGTAWEYSRACTCGWQTGPHRDFHLADGALQAHLTSHVQEC